MNDFEKMNKAYKSSALYKASEQIRKYDNQFKQFTISNDFAPDVANVFSEIERINEINKPIRNYSEQLNKLNVNNDAFYKIEKQIMAFQRAVELTIKKTPNNLYYLAKYGWYINFNSDYQLAVNLDEAIKNEKIEMLDRYLSMHYKSNIDFIFSELKRRHPGRAHIFYEILNAYNSKNYYTCIPTIFSQIDGVCKDVISIGFFDKFKRGSQHEYLPILIEKLEEIEDGFLRAFLFPIYNNTPAIAHKSTLNNFPCKLNRHKVIHGEDTTYGNEINCLKCLSLLIYISDVIEFIRD